MLKGTTLNCLNWPHYLKVIFREVCHSRSSRVHVLQFTELVSLNERIPALPALKCELADHHPCELQRAGFKQPLLVVY